LEPLEDRSLLTPFTVGGDPIVHPEDFRITTFADGLNYPHGMTTLPDGSLAVAVNNPNNGGVNFFDTTGEILRFTDTNNDGVADGPPTVLINGLPGEVTALHQAGDLLLATSSQSGSERITVLRRGTTADAPLTVAGVIEFQFLSYWEHTTFASAARPTPDHPGSFDVFFNIGSEYNGVVIGSDGKVVVDAMGNPTYQPTTDTVPASGLVTATLLGDSIYETTMHSENGSPVFSTPIRIASGLRNAASMAFDPHTGDFYFADNGIDGNAGGNEAWSADELNRIPAAQIGGDVENFGFPYSYTKTIDKPGDPVMVVNPSGGIQPVVAFEPLPDPVLTVEGSESEGPSGFALSPPMFPDGLNQGVFLGFHGLFDQGGTANDENPFVFANPATGHYFDFISNNEPSIGHIDEALSTRDSLFIADISKTGELFGATGPHQGAIYQIKAINHAPVLAPIEGRTAVEGSTLTFTAMATDRDPGQTLTFSLDPGAPASASINPTTGVFSFHATEESGPVPVTVRVTDNGSPQLSVTQTFSITVSDAPLISVGARTVQHATQGVATPATIIARFTDAGTSGSVGDYTATIDWGDHSKTTSGKVHGLGNQTFVLTGSHIYYRVGTYRVAVVIRDDGGSFVVATNTKYSVLPPPKASVLFYDSFNTDHDPTGDAWNDANHRIQSRQAGLLAPRRYVERPQTAAGGVLDSATEVDNRRLRNTLRLAGLGNMPSNFTYVTPAENFFRNSLGRQHIHVEIDPLGPGSAASTQHWAALVFGDRPGSYYSGHGTALRLRDTGAYELWDRGHLLASGHVGARMSSNQFYAVDFDVNLLTGAFTLMIDGHRIFGGSHGAYATDYITLEDLSSSTKANQFDYFDDLTITAFPTVGIKARSVWQSLAGGR
jgi:glucose/arabinose dehydrogenase